ncbi:hypothetical protein [Amycolatopsis sp. NPDC051061]|uniref:hypothetical protein n=1 Tax=Amycolatopsis sp. NPDC051061 TaxID=3155042 RepID=UPI00343FD2F0
MQALLGFTSEACFLRHARVYLGHVLRYLPGQSDYNKRLRNAASLVKAVIRLLALTPRCGPMRYGWSTPPRRNAFGREKPRNARIWPDRLVRGGESAARRTRGAIARGDRAR